MLAAWPSYAMKFADIPPAGEARITLVLDQGSNVQPGTYEVRVYRSNLRPPPPSKKGRYPAGKGYAADWKLTIRCIDKCTCPRALTEDLGWGSPYGSGLMGIWQVLDVSPAVVTSWQEGEGYAVNIYGCRAGRLERWLDEWSLGSATVTLGAGQMPVVSAPDRDGNHPVVWSWDGQRYVSSGEPVAR